MKFIDIKEKINNLIKKARAKTYAFLRWTEKWTKTDMIYLAKSGFWLNLSQIISAITGLILTVIFANLIDKNTYGIYKYILNIAGLLSLTTLTGIGTALTQSIARGKDGNLEIALIEKIKWGLFGSIISISIALYNIAISNYTLAISFFIVSFFIPLMDSFSLYDSYLIGKKSFHLSSGYNISIKILATISTLAVILITSNIFFLLLIYFISNTLLRLTALLLVNKNIPEESTKETDSAMIPYGKHLSVINLVSSVTQYMDGILLFNFIGANQLAIYSIATALPENLKNLLKFIQPISLPKFAQQNKIEIKKQIYNKMIRVGLAILIIIVLYIIFSPFIFRLLYPGYQDSILYSQLFSLSLIYFVIALPVTALQAQMEQKKLYQFYTITSVFQIIILLPMAFFYGIMGVVVARIIARFFQVITMIYIINKL